MIACSDCLARCKQNLIDTKDELVVFPSSALRLKSNTTITKYDVGYVNITKEELYNAEQAGSFQHDDNNVWYLYDVKLTKIARLTPEYLDYAGVSKLTNVPTLDEILAEFHQNNWPIDFASPEFDSYREYLDIIFHAYEVDNDPDMRGRTCSRATPCIASLGASDNVC